MDPYQILLDAPGSPTARLQIAALGDFKSKRYGKFSITRDDVESWQRNLEHLPGGRAPIDFDHNADRVPRNTEAAGWITGISLDGDKPVAEVEWSDKGEDSIRNKRYLFFSPTYGDHTDESGTTYANALIGGALTNRPFLSSMPAITLASEENLRAAVGEEPAVRLLDNAEETMRLLEALTGKQRDKLPDSAFVFPDTREYPLQDLAHARNALARGAQNESGSRLATIKAAVYKKYPQLKSDSGGASDSRRTMDKALLKQLGLDGDESLVTALSNVELDEDAERKLLDAATGLRTQADTPAEPAKPEPPKTLEQQAADNGKVLLDADEWRQTKSDASAGAAAQKQLHEQRFEHAFDAALKDPKGARVLPAEKDDLKALYELDADRVIKMIDAREPAVPAEPHGNRPPAIQLETDDRDHDELAAAGVHPASHDAYKKVQARLKQLDKPQSEFSSVLQQMIDAGEI